MRSHQLSRSMMLLAASAALAAVRSPHADATMVLTPTAPGEQTNNLTIAPIVTKEMLAGTQPRLPAGHSKKMRGRDLNPASIIKRSGGGNDEKFSIPDSDDIGANATLWRSATWPDTGRSRMPGAHA